MRRLLTLTLLLGCLPLAGCWDGARRDGRGEAIAEKASKRLEHDLTEILDGVRIDPERRLVEFDAVVAVDCHDPETPVVYLEVICCTPDTREHEALVVTRVPPSFVHAALLAVGAEPGRPGGWRREGEAIVPTPPSGSRVLVSFVVRDGAGREVVHDPAEWIVQHATGRSLREMLPDTAWAFAGSRMREFRGREVYDADGTGQLIGLHTFGSETIAWMNLESPEAAIDQPQWLTNNDLLPAIGTPVVVRLEVLPGE